MVIFGTMIVRAVILASLIALVLPLNSVAQGLVSDTWPNGQTKSEGIQINGVNHGTWRYHDEEGRLTATVHYDYGADTLRTEYEYNSYGDLYSKTIRRHGLMREMWTNLTPKKTNYEGFHENGALQLKGDLKSDLREGKWLEYDEKGELLFRLEFRKDELVQRTEIHRVFGVNPNVEKNYLTNEMASSDIPIFCDSEGIRFQDLKSIGKFYAGELYFNSDTLNGYIAMTKEWRLHLLILEVR